MKKMIQNPLILILGSILVVTVSSTIQEHVDNANLSHPKAALPGTVNLVSQLLLLICFIGFIYGIVLGIKWLVNKRKSKV
ncbi:MAG: hypothetical protein ABSB12_01990 [Candidatus Saccharimonadales bacterium]|jgi:hypothetical protein